MSRRGPKLKEIDWEKFEQLCALQCTQEEMAGMLKVEKKTLARHVEAKYKLNYVDTYKKLSSVGKCSLRRSQFVQSKKNAGMAIWLGKQWLGQKEPDRVEQAPPNDALLDLTTQLLSENKSLKEQLDGLKSKANPELSGSQRSN
jgi:hypothetical protein